MNAIECIFYSVGRFKYLGTNRTLLRTFILNLHGGCSRLDSHHICGHRSKKGNRRSNLPYWAVVTPLRHPGHSCDPLTHFLKPGNAIWWKFDTYATRRLFSAEQLMRMMWPSAPSASKNVSQVRNTSYGHNILSIQSTVRIIFFDCNI